MVVLFVSKVQRILIFVHPKFPKILQIRSIKIRNMETDRKAGRYGRINNQLVELLKKSSDLNARLSTVVAVLHHKMDYYFWTGFYIMHEGELVVRTYQGPVACQVLEKGRGVCWASITRDESIVVEDVHLFPGHIACDSRSNSEIVVPLRNEHGELIGVLDVDSKEKGSFDEVDREWLERIVGLI
jgi:L-methionine (R)-S-oxide reductase